MPIYPFLYYIVSQHSNTVIFLIQVSLFTGVAVFLGSVPKRNC